MLDGNSKPFESALQKLMLLLTWARISRNCLLSFGYRKWFPRNVVHGLIARFVPFAFILRTLELVAALAFVYRRFLVTRCAQWGIHELRQAIPGEPELQTCSPGVYPGSGPVSGDVNAVQPPSQLHYFCSIVE